MAGRGGGPLFNFYELRDNLRWSPEELVILALIPRRSQIWTKVYVPPMTTKHIRVRRVRLVHVKPESDFPRLEIGLSRNSVWLTFEEGTQCRCESLNVFVCPPQFEPASVKSRSHQEVALHFQPKTRGRIRPGAHR